LAHSPSQVPSIGVSFLIRVASVSYCSLSPLANRPANPHSDDRAVGGRMEVAAIAKPTDQMGAREHFQQMVGDCE